MAIPNVVTYLDSTAPVFDVGNVAVTTGSLAAPATMADGDFLFVVVRLQDPTLKTLTLPAGWAQVNAASGTGSFSSISFYFVWHRVTATAEPATYTFDWTGQGAARFGGIIHRYAGVSTTAGPWAGSVAAWSTGATLPALTYTSTTPGQGIWAYGALNSGLTVTPPPTYTKRSTLNPSGSSSFTVADRPDQPGSLSSGAGSVDVADAQVIFAGTLIPAHTNVAPTANAGADLYAEPNEEVFLTGSGSDPEGVGTVRWSQVGGPTVQMYGIGSTVSFYAPTVLAGVDLTFQLTVTDTSLATATDTTVVHVSPPTVRALKNGTWQPALLLLQGLEPLHLPSSNINTLTQTFADIAGFTQVGGTTAADAAAVSGQLRIVANPGYPSIVSDARYDLTNSAIYAQLVTAPNVGNGSVQTFLTLSDSTGNQIDIGWSGGEVVFRQSAGGQYVGSTAAYVPATDVWLRISHDGTNIIWATSADKVTWTTRRIAAPTIPITRLQVILIAGNYLDEPAPGTAVWDNLNS